MTMPGIRKRAKRRATVLLLSCFLPVLAFPILAQTLARPGWAGSGMTTQSWFKHAVFYRIDVRTFAHGASSSESDGAAGGNHEEPGNLKGIIQHLDYLHSLGVDAILLSPLAPSLSAAPTSDRVTIDPALGTLEDFDELSLQAGRRSIRVLLTLPKPNPVLVRSWLTRGVAGFYLPDASRVEPAALQAIRRLMPTFVGQRVLITSGISPAASARSANELVLDTLKLPGSVPVQTSDSASDDAESTGVTVQLRLALDHPQPLLPAPQGPQAIARTPSSLLAIEPSALQQQLTRIAPPGHEIDAAKIVATLLLLNRSIALIDAGQEVNQKPNHERDATSPQPISQALGSSASTPHTIAWGTPSTIAADTPETPDSPAPAPKPDPATFGAYVPYVPEKYSPAARQAASSAAASATSATAADLSTAFGQEAIPASLFNFYRHLIQLHHGDAAVRDGEQILVDHDDANALVWIRKSAVVTSLNPPVLIVCNLADRPLEISLKPDMVRLHLRGSFLRTLLRSDAELGAMEIERMNIPPFGVYVGELRY